MTNLHEPVVLRFGGHERTLPLIALAITLRRSPEQTARTLDVLIHGPPERRPASTTDASVPLPPSHGEGVGGGARSERSASSGSETIESGAMPCETFQKNIEAERSDPERSDRERCAGESGVAIVELARRIAIDLGDENNERAIRRLVETYPRPVLEQALRRTLLIPVDRIRSTRGAIFTGIVRKLGAHLR